MTALNRLLSIQGIDQYSGDPKTEFHLVDLNGKVSVLQAVTNIDQKSGLTKTGFAINYTLANSLIPSAGARSGVRQVKAIPIAQVTFIDLTG